MDDVDEAAIGEALWRYAETVTGVRRDSSGEVPGGRLTAGRAHLARLSAAIGHGASYPMLAGAAGTARQTAWKLYRSRAIDP